MDAGQDLFGIIVRNSPFFRSHQQKSKTPLRQSRTCERARQCEGDVAEPWKPVAVRPRQRLRLAATIGLLSSNRAKARLTIA